jgi:hypothetical protein
LILLSRAKTRATSLSWKATALQLAFWDCDADGPPKATWRSIAANFFTAFVVAQRDGAAAF